MAERLGFIAAATLGLCLIASAASAQDADLCFATADRIKDGSEVSDKDREAGHQACQRALADTSSIVQKYQLQEADFDVTGTRPKQ